MSENVKYLSAVAMDQKAAMAQSKHMSQSDLPAKTRYAIVGTGSRSFMFSDAILRLYKDNAELVAICDINPKRMEAQNAAYAERLSAGPVPTYLSRDFDKMVEEKKPHIIIVTTIDCTHHFYIIRAMELGCDVITEKPMTIDAEKCQAVLDTVKKTGRSVRVAFNYRYAPSRTKVKELLRAGTIGDVKSIHFEWLLDTRHGADYFRRWHRDKSNSGGLMVHKSTHHFDLVNWWLESSPVTVFGLGSLAFYGRANALERGDYRPYYRSTDSPAAEGDPFAINLRNGASLEKLYLNAESEDGYLRDQNVFGDGISIEDTMNVAVRYANGAQLSYTLTAYSPWEGLRIAFNGTRGRIEMDELEKSYIAAGNSHIGDGLSTSQRLTVFPHFKPPYHVQIPEAQGGHGGGDLLLLNDLFGKGDNVDPLGRAAGHIDGARSILTGIAANKSFATGLPVDVRTLVQF